MHETALSNGEHSFRRLAKRLPGAGPVAKFVRRIVLPEHREIDRLQRDEAHWLFQPFPTTGEDRYPGLFDALVRHLADIPSPRVLSFGCSSGEEVRALRKRLPGAKIVGIDLNRRMIAKARLADPSPLSEYRCDGAPRPDERYDAVLALAVFRHGSI